MRALHVSASDAGGGAARAAFRVHRAIQNLEDCRWHSAMLVARKLSDDRSIHTLEQHPVVRSVMSVARRAIDQTAILSRTPNRVFRSPANLSTNVVRRVAEIRPDVTVLHWLGSRMMSVRQIGRMASEGRPLVWVLHDTWTFCGAEHYPHGESDRRFVDGYDRENRLPGERGLDLNRRVWQRKRKHWARPINLIAPSRWMADQALGSAIAGDWPVTVIPYPIDVAWWGGTERFDARRRLGLDRETPVLLYGALGGDMDSRKGSDLLYEALGNVATHHGLRPSLPLEVLTFGGAPRIRSIGAHRVRSVGQLDDEGLRDFYAAADVMVVPSRIDNLPQTAVEAMVCGTPVVAFRTGGLVDIVDDFDNGRLADSFSPESLAKAIAWVLESPDRHRRLSDAARASASRWEPSRIANRYVDVFEEMLNR